MNNHLSLLLVLWFIFNFQCRSPSNSEQTFEIPKNPSPTDLPPNVERLTGIYSLADQVTYTITYNDGKLIGQRSGGEKEELFCESGNVFFTENNARIRKIFISEGDSVNKMLDRRGGFEIVWKKID